MVNADEYIGMKYGYLEVIGTDPDYVGKTYNSNHWLLRCKCGNVISEYPSRILSGHKQSCGCKKVNQFTKHGYCKDPFYHVWWSMMQRCNNPNHCNYARYGARGISICESWKRVENFIKWAHETYDAEAHKKTLDRIDNNGNYTPDNCRWATPKVQSNNRRNTKICTINEVTKSLSEWCDEYGMPISVVGARMRVMGWDALKALTTPVAHFDERGVLVEISGEQKTIKAWCEQLGIQRSTVYGRVRKGMDLVTAITTPVKK